MSERPSEPGGVDEPNGHDGAPALPALNPVRRQVKPRDWVVVAVVAALAIGLASYLIFRPDSNTGADIAGGATSSGTVAASSSGTPSSEQDNSGANTPLESTSTGTAGAAPTDAGSANDGSNPNGVVDSMDQPPAAPAPGIPDDETAGRIGPFGDLARRIDGDPLAKGQVNAPVVMVIFSDYRCPFCALFSRTTEREIVKKYVDTGVLRIEWRDLPIFGPESVQAAVAGRAAAEQGMFWEYNRTIYATAPQQGHADLTRKVLIDFAKTAGIPDLKAFAAALDDPQLAADVQVDVSQSSLLGVPSTPAFVIDGYPLLGAQPLEEFSTLIDTVQTLS